MGKYFNKDAEDGTLAGYERLQVIPMGGDESGSNGYQLVIGGYTNAKGKLTGANVLAHADTKEEMERLLETLCSIA